MTDHGDWTNTQQCTFTDGEVITDIHVHVGTFQLQGLFTVMDGMEVVTTEKSCGLWGKRTNVVHTASGYQLLYIEGRIGYLIDGLTFTFDFGCQKKIIGQLPDQ